MKKLTIIICLFLCSCDRHKLHQGTKITSISEWDDSGILCKYCTSDGDGFIDSCGKFTVGDVIKIVKQ